MSRAMLGRQKMLSPDLLASLDSGQIEALISTYESTLAMLRVRLEAARFAAAQRATHRARAARARAARTHDAAERRLIVWKLYRRGLSDHDIAARVGVSIRTVQRAIRALAVAT
jgi:DNA-binding NarL/FixJ family response regulator